MEDINEVIRREYEKGTPVREIALIVNRNRSRVIKRAKEMGLTHPASGGGIIRSVSSLKGDTEMNKLNDDELSEVMRAERVAKLARESKTVTDRKYKLAMAEVERLEAEISAITGAMEHEPQKFAIHPRPNKKGNAATPFIVLSDWHVEEEVDPRTIGGKNKFNLSIAKKRSERVFQNSLRLIQDVERDNQVDTVAVFIIGDFITGSIHLENIATALLDPMMAINFAQDLLESGIDFLLENTTHNYVFYCKVGNHSRMAGFDKRVATEAGNSLETGMYLGMKRNYRDNPRVKFEFEPSYYSITTIQGVRVRYHHGHAVSYGGGIGGLHIPLRKAIKSWNETERADVDIMGHYHSFMEHATMKYIVNGSLIGYSAYAERVKAVIEPPVQAFGIFHAKYGMTRVTPIFTE